jgi:aprataxin
MNQAAKQSSPYVVPKAQTPANKWSDALKKYTVTPELFPDEVLEYNDMYVIINDAYPKAKTHMLIMPTESIDSVWDLTSSHLNLLKSFKSKAEELTLKHKDIKAGFHAIPSMSHLHCHIISQDFDSPRLKTKHHYLSFTTDFWIPLQLVIDSVEEHGTFKHSLTKKDFEEMVKVPLVCHKCRKVQKNMPSLKQHLAKHLET